MALPSFGFGGASLPQSGAAGGVDPVLLAGLGLLSSRRNPRIDPFQSITQGLLTGLQLNRQQKADQLDAQRADMQKQDFDWRRQQQQMQTDALGKVRGLLEANDIEGAARAAVASGDPSLTAWGGGLLSPKKPAEIQTLEYLNEHPELMDVHQKMRSAGQSSTPYYTGQLSYDKDGNLVPLNFDARTGRWSATPINGLDASAPTTTQPSTGQPGASAAPRPFVPGISLLPAAHNPAVQGAKSESEASGKVRGESGAKRDVTMLGVTGVIDQADKILAGEGGAKPTSSGFGSIVDRSAAFFGATPEGAPEADQLRAIAGQLTSKMPRMEGPQSNYDVALYQQMAGDVGNDSIPIERRRAALAEVRRLVSKYDKAGQQGAAAPSSPANSGWGIQEVGR